MRRLNPVLRFSSVRASASVRAFALALFVCSSLTVNAEALHKKNLPARIAIIIDDIGYHYGQGKKTIELPGNITLAVIPFTPNATKLAELGHLNGKEIMLHAPMANASGTPMETGALDRSMGQEAFIQRLRESIESVPHVRGLNNHMGSLLTRQIQPMAWLMSELKRRRLYFVDSRTSADSVAWQSAREQSLPTLKRDIFLDHERTPAFISRQFQRLLNIADTRGQAVGIGHPYPETLAFLAEALPELSQRNIELVFVSAILEKPVDYLPPYEAEPDELTPNPRDRYDIEPVYPIAFLPSHTDLNLR